MLCAGLTSSLRRRRSRSAGRYGQGKKLFARHQQRKKRDAPMTGYVGSIENETVENAYFRHVLFTGTHAQLVVMCLQPGEQIGKEMHPNVDQFFRIEQGEAKFV